MRPASLKSALGDGTKRIEGNEEETVVIQRRALRVKKDLRAGTILVEDHLEPLRPCPIGSVPPSRLAEVLGKTLARDKEAGRELLWTDLI